MTAPRNRSGIGLTLVAGGLVVAASMVLTESGTPSPAIATRSGDDVDARSGPERSPLAQSPARRTELTVASAAVAAADVPQDDAASERDRALARSCTRLRSALEASLSSSLDPGAILDAALELGQLDVDRRAYSEPDLSGCTVYPLLAAPEGTRAELWIGRASKPEVDRVLSLRIELDGEIPPYVLEGCSRACAIAQIQVQLDHEGKPLNLTILTDFPPSGRNLELGIGLEQGTIAQGVLCSFDADDLDVAVAREHGLANGHTGSWDDQNLQIAGLWPAPEKVSAFGDLLQRKYEAVSH